MRFARVAAHAIVAAVIAASALRSTSEPQRPRALKTASREIFAKRRASQGRRAAYRFGASRENACTYENVRQDRQSLQTDPVGYEDDLNLYQYVSNDPLNRSDPTGRQEERTRVYNPLAVFVPGTPENDHFVATASWLLGQCHNSSTCQEVYPGAVLPNAEQMSDSLRLHEPFMETGDNQAVLNRLMNGIEHILMIHYVLYLKQVNPTLLSKMCIISDGPLAVFGELAPLHRGIMRILGTIREQQKAQGLDEPLILGFSKTGRVVEHFQSIENIIAESQPPKSFIFPVSDEYRYKYLEPTKDPTVNHGDETYYGQDFYIRLPSGRGFVMGVPYPFKDRSGPDFQTAKSDISHYGNAIGRALRIVQEFESDLYGSSLVPITLAHQHASISLKPGGRVLDILSKQSLGAS